MVSFIEKTVRDSSRMVRRSPVLTISSRVNKNLNKKQSKPTSTNLKNIISIIRNIIERKPLKLLVLVQMKTQPPLRKIKIERWS
jgi:hypothetical protein